MLSGWEGVLVAPEDDDARLVLADQLMARGDPLGEFITLSCRRARLSTACDGETVKRLAELWEDHGEEFTERFGAVGARLHFSRGLPSRLVSDAELWLSMPEIPAPIQRVELSNVSSEHLPQILARPTLARLFGLHLESAGGWGMREARLLGSARAPKLRHLGLRRAFTHANTAEHLLASALMEQLRSFSSSGSMGDDPARSVALLAARELSLTRVSLEEPLPGWPTGCRWEATGSAFRGLWGPSLHWRSDSPKPGWAIDRPLGQRPGLDVALLKEPGGTRSLWLQAGFASNRDDDFLPGEWFSPLLAPDPAVLGAIDEGDADDGLWQLMPIATGRRLDVLRPRAAELEVLDWAGAFAPLVDWLARHPKFELRPFTLFVSPLGVQLHPLSPDLVEQRQPAGLPGQQTLAQMPPEVLQGQRREPGANVYVVAAICARLGGVELAPGRSAFEMISAVRDRRVSIEPGPRFPRAIALLLNACLARTPAERPTLHQLAEELALYRTPKTTAALTQLLSNDSDDEAEARLSGQAALWLESRTRFEQIT